MAFMPSMQKSESALQLGDQEDAELLEKGQTCLGESTEVERMLDSKCPCLTRSKCVHFSWTFLLYVIAAFALVYFCRQYLHIFLLWLQKLDKWISVIIFVIMFTLVSFPMTWGYIVLNLAAGYIYGFVTGLLTVSFAVSIGVTTSVIICRKFLRSFVQSKLQSSHLKAIIQVIESRKGFKVVVLTRLTPIPFGLQNGLFAITNISISRLAIASLIGLLPTQALNSYMGSTLRTINDVVNQDKSKGYVVIFCQVVISLGLMWYVIKRARYELNKVCLPESKLPLVSAQSLEESKSPTMNGFRFSSSVLEQYDLVSDVEILREKNENKYGHKRAKSASAILIDIDGPS